MEDKKPSRPIIKTEPPPVPTAIVDMKDEPCDPPVVVDDHLADAPNGE